MKSIFILFKESLLSILTDFLSDEITRESFIDEIFSASGNPTKIEEEFALSCVHIVFFNAQGADIALSVTRVDNEGC